MWREVGVHRRGVRRHLALAVLRRAGKMKQDAEQLDAAIARDRVGLREERRQRRDHRAEQRGGEESS